MAYLRTLNGAVKAPLLFGESKETPVGKPLHNIRKSKRIGNSLASSGEELQEL